MEASVVQPVSRGERPVRILGSALLWLAAAGLWWWGTREPAALHARYAAATVEGEAPWLPLAAVPSVLARLRLAALVAALSGFLWALPATGWARRGAGWLAAGAALLRAAPARLVRGARGEPRTALAVLGATLLALAASVSGLQGTLRADESTTYLAYAREPALVLLTRYDSANNHPLHSLLARASTLLVGPAPWALRLPAWLAGLACVPAAFAAARAHFGRRAGVAAALLVASWPYLADLATNARGYTLVNLASLVLLALVPGLVASPTRERRAAFVLAAAGGLASVPVMLFSLAGVALAFLACAWRSAARPSFARRARELVGLLCGAAALAAAVYLPALLFTNEAMRAELVRVAEWERRQPFHAEWVRLVREGQDWWLHGQGRGGMLLVGVTLLVGLARERKARELLASFLLGLALVGLASAPPPVWAASHLLVVGLLLVGAGLARSVPGRPAPGFAAACALFTLLDLAAWRRVAGRLDAPWFIGYPDAAEATAFLLEEHRGAEPPTVVGWNDAMCYYALLAGERWPRPPLAREDGAAPGERAWVIHRPWPPHVASHARASERALREKGLGEPRLERVLPFSWLVSLRRPPAQSGPDPPGGR